jgi:Fic-DOC domain mobile mystery protein B
MKPSKPPVPWEGGPEDATPFDADGLLLTDVHTLADLNAAEAEGIMSARNRHLKRRKNPDRTWLTDAYIRRVHRDMFDELWSWAGTYRTSNVQPGIPFPRISTEIGLLCRDVESWDKQTDNPLPILERAVRLHHRLVQIHPYRNGNGRHARLMSDIYLRAHSHPLPEWPYAEITQEGTSPRKEYVLTLKAADRGDYQPLLSYTRRYL